jgi:iron(III) transport system substrate-binding protein
LSTVLDMLTMHCLSRARRSALPLVALLVALLVAGTLTACSDGGDDGEVTIYSGRTEDLIGPLLERFADETGIDVNVKYDDSANLALLIAEEGDNSPADVFLSQSPGAVGFLDQQGRLAALPADVLDLVVAEVRAGDGHWVGFSGRKRVLNYNAEAVDASELPSSVLDMTDPKWKGRLGIAPSNGSFQDFVTAMRLELGDDATRQWLEGIEDNDAQTYPNNNAIVAAVDRGEIDVGLVNHYYNYRFVAEDPDHQGLNHEFAADDIGSLLIVTAASLVEGSDNREEALRLIRFLLEEEAQRYFSDETFEYPLAAGVEPSSQLPPIEFTKVESIDFDQLGGDLDSTRALISEAGLEG